MNLHDIPLSSAASAPAAEAPPLLEVIGLKKHYPVDSGGAAKVLRAVDGVSLSVPRGQTLSLVGESGCGKSTTGKCLIRLTDPTEGRILLEGRDLAAMNSRELRAMRQRMQFIFQDPFSSMNPRMRVRDIIGEPLRAFGHGRAAIRDRVAQLLARVSLRPDAADRYPHEFSGGQRQRIVIARALALDPGLIVCDEPVSALDVSVQAQVINLLMDLQRDLGLTYVFISHDLSVVRHISHRVAVMYLGKIVETGTRDAIYERSAHPYTRALLAAVPSARQGERAPVQVLKGEIPSPLSPPSGCAFRTRCPMAQPRCAEETPQPRQIAPDQQVACHFAAPI
ncbi:ABC transporter ATP-binding protein [Achromobacter anxifer]|jgi:oligopeptide/dipeptide ABC transporter ATP-binding protein|uniref:ABC transporter ATP-binding protein n=1 Tax=Achromobacter anxifer TaxID=1287737 RepID=UPI002158091C|nr:dipeptide ABC transporter ATP-binding protein [Achromobacter anxifer]